MTDRYQPSAADGYQGIKDYALIGDCGSAALVSRGGSIDWLCWPRFDSPSFLAAILDVKKGGHFRIAPTSDASSERKYVDGTNVLETTFRTETGAFRLTDMMAVAEEDTYYNELWSDHEILRCVECIEGSVEIEVDFYPAPDYARSRARLSDRGWMGFLHSDGTDVYVFRSEIDLQRSSDRDRVSGRCRLQNGDRRLFSLSFDYGEPAVFQPLGEAGHERIQRTIDFWKRWSGRCEYDGPFRDIVLRSALALKLMTYSRSGAVIAAPTTSLPEHIGGVRNWDYRFCWPRDASMTLRALFELGYRDEGRAFLQWLMQTAHREAPSLSVLYDVHGGTRTEESTLDHLEGYKGSRPVRIGNQAGQQLQLDTYGEVIAAAYEFWTREVYLGKWQHRLLVRLGETVCERWREPDHGIWEIRSGPRHHTFSKAMCWVALDRLLKMHEEAGVDMPVARFTSEREAIRQTIETHGFNNELNSYVSVLDGETVDASLLLLQLYGYRKATDDRMRGTFAQIQKTLAVNGLMFRYPHGQDDGLPAGEGAFGLCSFWDEEILAKLGRVDEAKRHFEEMLSYANDVGLFAEEIDVENGQALGNFPQAFTHVGLINAALTIDKAERQDVERASTARKEVTANDG